MTTKLEAERKISNTVTVTTDGRTEVNVKELFKKQHITKMIAQMRSKIQHVPAASREGENKLQSGIRVDAE